jgi:hypothetical protein
VLNDCVAQVFLYTQSRNWKTHYYFWKKIIGVDNVEDNDEDINQFEEMPLFTNPMNIKRIEKDFDTNLLIYMRKGGKEKIA